jgi:Protein of unknown function (DUF2442)
LKGLARFQRDQRINAITVEHFTWASMKERQQFRLIGSGEGIHWELLDEDVSVEGIVAGRRSMESAESFRRWLEDRKERGVIDQ